MRSTTNVSLYKIAHCTLVIHQTKRANITYEEVAHAFGSTDARNRMCFGARPDAHLV